MSINLNTGGIQPNNPFGSKASDITDRVNWAMSNAGDTTDKVGADGTVSAGGLQNAIAGLTLAIMNQDKGNAGQIATDSMQINFLQSLLQPTSNVVPPPPPAPATAPTPTPPAT